MKCIGLLLAAATAVTIGCAGPKDDVGAVGTSGAATAEPVAPPVTATSGDKDFVTDLTIANMAEVQLGRMVAERSMNAAVKQFGQTMVDDHTQAGSMLKDVAAAHNIPTPTAIDEKHQQLFDKLSPLHGAAFDKEYIDAMVNGHEAVLSKLESRIDRVSLADWKTRVSEVVKGKTNPEPPQVVPEQSDNAVTAALNQWAAGSYATVYRHYQSAKGIQETTSRTQTQ